MTSFLFSLFVTVASAAGYFPYTVNMCQNFVTVHSGNHLLNALHQQPDLDDCSDGVHLRTFNLCQDSPVVRTPNVVLNAVAKDVGRCN